MNAPPRCARQLLAVLLLAWIIPVITQGVIAGFPGRGLPVPETRPLMVHDRMEVADFDPAGPTLALISPANNSFVSGIVAGPVPVLIDVYPGVSASLDRDALILVNGTWFNMTDTSNGNYSSFMYPWDLTGPSGSIRTATMMVFDSAGRNNTYDVHVTTDNILPNCHFIAPVDNDYVTQDIMIRVGASDANSGIGSASITFIDPFGNSSQPIALQYIAGEWRYTWTCMSNLWSMGWYQVDLVVADVAGNVNTASVDILLDYTGPYLEVVSPLNQSILSGVQDIRFRIGDPVSSISMISARLGNGTVLPLTSTSFQDFYTRIDTSTLPDGQISVLVDVENQAGLLNSTRLAYVIDNQQPNGVLFGAEQINDVATFQYACNDSSGISRIAWHIDSGLLKDIPVSLAGNISITTRNFLDGVHVLRVIIEDNASPVNRRVIEKSIIIDNTNPEVSVQNLAPGMVIDPDQVIKIMVYDENPTNLTFSIDYNLYQAAEFDEQERVWTISIASTGLISGTHSIRLMGRDITGNVDEDFYIFTIYYKPSFGEQLWAWFVRWAILVVPAVAGAIILSAIVIRRKKQGQPVWKRTRKQRR